MFCFETVYSLTDITLFQQTQRITWAFKPDDSTNFFTLTESSFIDISTLTESVSADRDYFTLISQLRVEANFSSQGELRCQLEEKGNVVTEVEREVLVEGILFCLFDVSV